MTTLVMEPRFGLFDRLESPTAGREAVQLKRSVLGEFERLKVNGARTSWVFNDLQNLAHEHGTTVERSAVFTLAQRFLLALPRTVNAPELDVDQDGEVVLDWQGSLGRMLTVTLREDGRLSYAARLSSYKTRYGEDQFSDAIPGEILHLARQFALP